MSEAVDLDSSLASKKTTEFIEQHNGGEIPSKKVDSDNSLLSSVQGVHTEEQLPIIPDLSDLVKCDFSLRIQFDKLSTTIQNMYSVMSHLYSKNQKLEGELHECRASFVTTRNDMLDKALPALEARIESLEGQSEEHSKTIAFMDPDRTRRQAGEEGKNLDQEFVSKIDSANQMISILEEKVNLIGNDVTKAVNVAQSTKDAMIYNNSGIRKRDTDNELGDEIQHMNNNPSDKPTIITEPSQNLEELRVQIQKLFDVTQRHNDRMDSIEVSILSDDDDDGTNLDNSTDLAREEDDIHSQEEADIHAQEEAQEEAKVRRSQEANEIARTQENDNAQFEVRAEEEEHIPVEHQGGTEKEQVKYEAREDKNAGSAHISEPNVNRNKRSNGVYSETELKAVVADTIAQEIEKLKPSRNPMDKSSKFFKKINLKLDLVSEKVKKLEEAFEDMRTSDELMASTDVQLITSPTISYIAASEAVSEPQVPTISETEPAPRDTHTIPPKPKLANAELLEVVKKIQRLEMSLDALRKSNVKQVVKQSELALVPKIETMQSRLDDIDIFINNCRQTLETPAVRIASATSAPDLECPIDTDIASPSHFEPSEQSQVTVSGPVLSVHDPLNTIIVSEASNNINIISNENTPVQRDTASDSDVERLFKETHRERPGIQDGMNNTSEQRQRSSSAQKDMSQANFQPEDLKKMRYEISTLQATVFMMRSQQDRLANSKEGVQYQLETKLRKIEDNFKDLIRQVNILKDSLSFNENTELKIEELEHCDEEIPVRNGRDAEDDATEQIQTVLETERQPPFHPAKLEVQKKMNTSLRLVQGEVVDLSDEVKHVKIALELMQDQISKSAIRESSRMSIPGSDEIQTMGDDTSDAMRKNVEKNSKDLERIRAWVMHFDELLEKRSIVSGRKQEKGNEGQGNNLRALIEVEKHAEVVNKKLKAVWRALRRKADVSELARKADVDVIQKLVTSDKPPTEPIEEKRGDYAMLSVKPLIGWKCMSCDRGIAALDHEPPEFIPTQQFGKRTTTRQNLVAPRSYTPLSTSRRETFSSKDHSQFPPVFQSKTLRTDVSH